MPTAAIQLLKPHPAQMRTTYDLESLATLTLQVYERGLHDWQPIVASPNLGLSGSTKLSEVEVGRSGPEDTAMFHIISGHRRHMAQLLVFALRDLAAKHPEEEIDIEVVRQMLNTLTESLGSLEKVITSLLAKYGDEEVPYVTFEGSQKAEILALQAANYGGETPDVLGVAHSFRQALEAGATEEEIARNSGQHLRYVQNHLALTRIPAELAQRIAAGELPVSVAVAVADLPEDKRNGLSIFILANPSAGSGRVGSLTAKAIKECAATLKKWPGLQPPLMVKHQAQRNTARALVRLWSQVVEAYPEDAYAAAAMFIFRGVHEEPWASKEKLTLWFQALGNDTYFVEGHVDKPSTGHINWTAVVTHLITEVNCQSCPVAQLPTQHLRSDLSQGQGGPLGMPCRVVASGSGQAVRCLHGLAPNDPFDVRLPWDWSQHPGVVKEGGEYRVKSLEELQQAWQAQAEKERAEDEAQPVDTGDTEADGETAVSKPAAEPAAKSAKATSSQQPVSSPASTPPAKDSPIARQRSKIADFMKRHEQFAVSHPFATPCGSCRHRLESSPTKDESVPHCAWAGRLRNVTFKVLHSEEAQAPQVPVCRQFAPDQPWNELVPAHPSPPEIPRAWLKEQILHLVKAANQYGSRRNAFEFLTGRPMGANESYGDWFQEKLNEQGGELNDAQLFTLFVWAHAEWQRARGREFSLPVNGNGVQFAAYQEQSWKIKEEAA